MATRDLTRAFSELRSQKKAWTQLEQWTDENCVDGLLAPCGPYDDELELGSSTRELEVRLI